jgi:hypothetical protein
MNVQPLAILESVLTMQYAHMGKVAVRSPLPQYAADFVAGWLQLMEELKVTRAVIDLHSNNESE